MRRLARRAALIALALSLLTASIAVATTFRGAAIDDRQMRVKVRSGKDGSVSFSYSEVLVECSNGETLREPGAQHSGTLNDRNRFKDTIAEQVAGGVASSVVKGRIGAKKATGIVRFELTYDGGACRSGAVAWKAKRR